MPDIAETDNCQIVREDRGGACPVTRPPGAAHPCQPARRGGPAVILTAAGSGALRDRIRADCLARPVPRQAAP